MMKPSCTLALLALLAAAPAAAEPAESVTASVQQDDLTLASAAGRATFRGRVKAAADRVCGTVRVSPIREAGPVAACRAALFRSAELGTSLALDSGRAETLGTH